MMQDNTTAKVGDYLRRHVSPDSLTDMTNMLLVSIEEIVTGNKIRTIDISSDAEQMMQQFSTYGGLLRSLADLTSEKYRCCWSEGAHTTSCKHDKKIHSREKP